MSASESKELVHLYSRCSEQSPWVTLPEGVHESTLSSVPCSSDTCAALGTWLRSAPRASGTHLCLRNLPFKPSVPSPLLRSLSPEKLYLAWGRAVWLWLITYSSKSIIYASTVCPESFRPVASYAQKSGFETQKAFFALKTIVSTVSFQKPIL